LECTFRQWIYGRSFREWSLEYLGDIEQYHEHGTDGDLYRNAEISTNLYRRHLYADCHIGPDARCTGPDSNDLQRGQFCGDPCEQSSDDNNTVGDDL
jgi:hypothetical protein